MAISCLRFAPLIGIVQYVENELKRIYLMLSIVKVDGTISTSLLLHLICVG